MKHNKIVVRTYGASRRKAGPLLFVETNRVGRPDEAFFLLCEPSPRGKQLFVDALASYKRGRPIRTPEQYIESLSRKACSIMAVGSDRSEAASSEHAGPGSSISFAAGWLRGEMYAWVFGGHFSISCVTLEGNVRHFQRPSGTGHLEVTERLVVGKQGKLSELEQVLVSTGHPAVAAAPRAGSGVSREHPRERTRTPSTVPSAARRAADMVTGVDSAGPKNLYQLLSLLAEEGEERLLLVEREPGALAEAGEGYPRTAETPLLWPKAGFAAFKSIARGPGSALKGLVRVTEIAKGVLRSRNARRWVAAFLGLALAVILASVIWPTFRETVAPRVEEISEPPEPMVVPTAEPSRVEATNLASHQVVLSPKWTRTFRGAVTSSPAVWEGRVYFGCRDGNLYCLDAETGEQLWRFPAGAGIGASPAVSDGKVFVGAYNGRFWSLDAGSGEENWEFRTRGKIVSSPCVAAGRVVFGSYDRNLYCLSAQNGDLRWKYETAGTVWSSPFVDKGKVFFGSTDGSFYCLSLDSGKQRWKYMARGGVYSSPAAQGKVVCFGSIGKVFHFLEVSGGKELFRIGADREVRASPLVVDETAYIAADDGILRRIATRKKSVSWTFKAEREIRSTPFLSDGLLYVTSYDGRLYVLEASSGEEVTSFDTGAEIYSSPKVWGGKVYFGTNNGSFYCLELERPSP